MGQLTGHAAKGLFPGGAIIVTFIVTVRCAFIAWRFGFATAGPTSARGMGPARIARVLRLAIRAIRAIRASQEPAPRRGQIRTRARAARLLPKTTGTPAE